MLSEAGDQGSIGLVVPLSRLDNFWDAAEDIECKGRRALHQQTLGPCRRLESLRILGKRT